VAQACPAKVAASRLAHLCYKQLYNDSQRLFAASSTLKGELMKSSVTNVLIALGLIAIGVGFAAAGIYIGETDDAPGAALIGILLMIGAVALGVRTARHNV
jgi:hypothetical protein